MDDNWNIVNITNNSLSTINNSDNKPSGVITSFDDCRTFNFVFYTIILGIVIVLGIIGNYLSILVLQQDSQNKTAAFLLQSLAVADTLVLIISFLVLSLIFGLFPFIHKSGWLDIMLPYIVKYVHPFGYMAQCATIWITVLLAVNRYIAVVKPFLVHTWCTIRRARQEVLSVIIINIVINTPRFFQYNIIQIPHPDNANQTIKILEETAIGESSLFGLIYNNVLYTLIILVIPLFILIVMNGFLVKELKKRSKPRRRTNTRRKSFARRFSLAPPALPEEDNITFVMVIIIVVFIICHTPDRIMQLLVRFVLPKEVLKCGQPLYYFRNVCNLLIIINSSVNFVIYYLLRKRFRKSLIARLCPRAADDEEDDYDERDGSFEVSQNLAPPIFKDV